MNANSISNTNATIHTSIRPLLTMMKGILGIAIAIYLLSTLLALVMGAPVQAAPLEAEPTTAASPSPTPQADDQVDVPVATPEPTAGAPVKPTEIATEVVPEPDGDEPAEPTVGRAPTLYIVEKGDTLAVIARAHGVSVAQMLAVNTLDDPNLLYVGQALVIPYGAQPVPIASPSPVPAEPTPIPTPDVPAEIDEERWIDVDLSEQRLTSYKGSTPVRTTLVSTGLPATPTVVGQFRIWIKLRYDDMAGADYYIKDVPFVMYFFEGYGLHGVTWHGNFGHPMSHGCVNLPTDEAEWLFGFAEVGTLVNVHE